MNNQNNSSAGSGATGGQKGEDANTSTGATGEQYQGNDISTGSQTPEGVTSPSSDAFEGQSGGEGSDNGKAGS